MSESTWTDRVPRIPLDVGLAAFDPENDEFLGCLVDISSTGMLLRGPFGFEPEQRGWFLLRVLDSALEGNAELEARCIWSAPVPNAELEVLSVASGWAFTKPLDLAARGLLLSVVKELRNSNQSRVLPPADRTEAG